ncbi:MAG TPA: RagB/SusD family nutrient uptake outer membrane protein [Gemmatimonadaceae bacterium]|jgi:hypothetical protein|nr:RagB/SusD family nutrient uptake outer membrane protein [Gemmatimonadaceae bacterium]
MRTMLIATTALASLALTACKLEVTNPSVVDASKFNPSSDGTTLALSAQTNFYVAFQSVMFNGGLIADEIWTGAIRLQTNNIASRNFVGTDDIDVDFFAPMSLAVVSNISAAEVLKKGSAAASDPNLALASMNAGYSLLIMAETMCQSDIRSGPALSDTQLLDSAVGRFQTAVTVGTGAGTRNIVNTANVGLARAYLQLGSNALAATTAALVDTGFTAYVITSANPATLTSTTTNSLVGLANLEYVTKNLGQALAPAIYDTLNDPRVPVAQSSIPPSNAALQPPFFVDAKYNSYSDPIRLASSLEATFISAEALLHQGNTGPALTLIAAERLKGNQPIYSGGTDQTSVLTELLNQRAREFWMEAKKLGDLRRNPTVPLAGVVTDSVGATFYGAGKATFGSTLCVPIPPEEVDANPNLH